MSKTTTDQIINLIADAGLDYHDFNCRAAANRAAFDRQHGIDCSFWVHIAEMARPTISDADWTRAWEMAGQPNPYLDEISAA